jgi:hypothetical protein
VCRCLDIDLRGQTSASYNMRLNYERCLLEFEGYLAAGAFSADLADGRAPRSDEEAPYEPRPAPPRSRAAAAAGAPPPPPDAAAAAAGGGAVAEAPAGGELSFTEMLLGEEPEPGEPAPTLADALTRALQARRRCLGAVSAPPPILPGVARRWPCAKCWRRALAHPKRLLERVRAGRR